MWDIHEERTMPESPEQTAEPQQQKWISPKEAVAAAYGYFTELTGIATGVTVEEVELSQDHHWMVTLGHSDQGGGLPVPLGGRKQYKVFRVRADTGEVVSMKIRDI